MNDFGDISLLQLETFLTAAECKSISETARKLYISQSGATRQIKKLEDRMNRTLLARTNHGVELTESGNELFRRLKPLYSRINAAIYDVSSVRENTAGIRVACLESPEIFDKVTVLIKGFEIKYPALSIDLTVCGAHEMREGILAGKYDCAFTYSTFSHGLHNIQIRYHLHFDTYFAVAENSPAVEGDRINYQKLSECKLYLRMDRFDLSGSRDLNVCRAHGFTPKGLQYVSDDPASLALLMDGSGFSISGASFDLRNGVRLFKTEKPLEEEQYMVLMWNPKCCTENGRKFVESIPYISTKPSTMSDTP